MSENDDSPGEGRVPAIASLEAIAADIEQIALRARQRQTDDEEVEAAIARFEAMAAERKQIMARARQLPTDYEEVEAAIGRLEAMHAESKQAKLRVWQREIDKFSVLYQGAHSEERDLALLDDWLADEAAPRRYLITGPAACGKSALLVNWVARLGKTTWRVVFLPISMRLGTNRPELYRDHLADLLAEVEGSVRPSAWDDDDNGSAHYLADLLASSKQRLLLVLDGIDETNSGLAEIKFGNYFDELKFPSSLPSNVRVVVSARWLAPDVEGVGWENRLCWGGGRCRRVDMVPLDRPVQSGLFERWWQEHRRDWSEAEDDLELATVNLVLAVLACAHGPMEVCDLAAAVKQAGGHWCIDPTLRALRRLVATEDGGYVFAHPRLGEYVRSRLKREHIEAAIKALGRTVN